MYKKLQINIDELLFIMMGLFSTMTALSIGGISVFYFIILITVLQKIIRNRLFFRVSSNKSLFIILFVMFSLIINLLFMDYSDVSSGWKMSIIKNSIVFIILIVGINIVMPREERMSLRAFFMKGLYISSVIQLIWGGAQLLFWFTMRQSLNQIVFDNILHSNLNVKWTILSGGFLRITGISWEPAFYSLVMIAGFLLTSNKTMKILFVLGDISSMSRTGLIMLFALIVFEQLKSIKKKNFKNLTNMMMIVIGALLLFSLLFLLIPSLRNIFYNTYNSILMWNETTSGKTHFSYILLLPELLMKANWWNILFGFGYSGSGLPYTLYFNNVFWNRIDAWAVENEWLHMLLGMGVIGGGFFFYTLISNAFRSDDYLFKALMVCYVVGGVFYVFSGTWIIFYFFLNCDVGLE